MTNITKLPHPAVEEAVREIKTYLTKTLEVFDSGRVSEARGMLTRLYLGLDEYLPREKK
jgi:hypothetical protein